MSKKLILTDCCEDSPYGFERKILFHSLDDNFRLNLVLDLFEKLNTEDLEEIIETLKKRKNGFR